MTWGAIICARLGSRRFPGKVLADIHGKPMIRRIVERTAQANLGAVVVASPNKEVLDAVKGAAVCYLAEDPEEHENVLLRVTRAALGIDMRKVVRVTGDCPLVDPRIINFCLNASTHQIDYTSNVIRRTLPAGLDTEVLHLDLFLRMCTLVDSQRHREHVTLYVREHLNEFRTASVELEEGDYSQQDWRVDYPVDMDLIRDIYRACGPFAAWDDVLSYLLGGRSAQHLRVAAQHGSAPGNHPAPSTGDAASASPQPGPAGSAWYERQPRVSPSH